NQTFLRGQALTLSGNLFQARWLLQQQVGESFPMPFLVLLVFWLAIVFASFGLFAPRNATALVALTLCAMAVAGGIVFIAELDNPFLGLIHVSPDSMHQALAQIMH